MKIDIVGMRYRSYYDAIDMARSRNYSLSLERDNKHDKYAIKFLYEHEGEKIHAGYVSKKQNQNKQLRNLVKSKYYTLDIYHLTDAVILANISEKGEDSDIEEEEED